MWVFCVLTEESVLRHRVKFDLTVYGSFYRLIDCYLHIWNISTLVKFYFLSHHQSFSPKGEFGFPQTALLIFSPSFRWIAKPAFYPSSWAASTSEPCEEFTVFCLLKRVCARVWVCVNLWVYAKYHRAHEAYIKIGSKWSFSVALCASQYMQQRREKEQDQGEVEY